MSYIPESGLWPVFRPMQLTTDSAETWPGQGLANTAGGGRIKDAMVDDIGQMSFDLSVLSW